MYHCLGRVESTPRASNESADSVTPFALSLGYYGRRYGAISQRPKCELHIPFADPMIQVCINKG